MDQKECIPKRVFIVPYRNRIQHKFFFCKYMSFILEDHNDYEIYFSHQCDMRTFNRGAMKDIGFLAVKNKYPNDYKDITFIFNDVDTIPFNKIFDYQTTPGVVKHYYGYKYALGGIVVIKGSDFEKINGFPCYWGWGMEDNSLQKRCEKAGIVIDRSIFYNIGSPEILQLFDGITRIISKKDPWRSTHDDGIDGLNTITKLNYTINDKSDNPNDNIFTYSNSRIHFINIFNFLTLVPFEQDNFYNYDLREPKRKILNPAFVKETKKVVATTNDWTNIPYYPTTKERRENVVNYLNSQGVKIPEALLKQIEQDKIEEQMNDVYNPKNIQPVHVSNINIKNNNYNQQQKHHNNQHHNQHHNQQFIHAKKIPHKFSPDYATHIGQRPRAQASARIGLGGVY
jgi:hypothetical protein